MIASGGAARYNGWGRGRDPDHGLARWLGRWPKGEYEVVDVGAGRFVYVPEWEVALPWDFSDWYGISLTNDPPVLDRATFLRAIDDATVGRPLTFRVRGPAHVWVEAIAGPEGRDSGVDLHFVNYDESHTSADLFVRVALPEGATSARVVATDPHEDPPRVWQPAVKIVAGAAAFKLPSPKVYGLAQVTFA